MQGQTPTRLKDALIHTLRGTCKGNVGYLWTEQRFAGDHFCRRISRQAVFSTTRFRRDGRIDIEIARTELWIVM